MLEELRLSNFALMQREVVRFSAGLNVITGETGSGKSLLLHGLELVLGARMKSHLLRSGGEDAEVEALFSLADLAPKTREDLPDLFRDSEELVVTRTVSAHGRSKVYLNGRLGTLGMLEETVSHLVNICAQNQQVRLLEARYHRVLLDDFGGLDALRERYQRAYEEWHQLNEGLRAAEETKRRDASRRDELEMLVSELSAIRLHAGIRAELETQVRRLASGESLASAVQAILASLEEQGGLHDQLQRIQSQLNEIIRLDPSAEEHVSLYSGAVIQLEEFERDMRHYVDGLSLDQAGLAALREQLAEVARLERKYRTNDVGLIELLERSKQSLAVLGDSQSIEKLAKLVEEKRLVAVALSRELSQKRQRKGRELAVAVINELAELNMVGSQFEVRQAPKELGPDGADTIEFLISTIKHEPAKPLKQVASGGELSRIMLVLKKVLKEKTGVNVLVFDEVDSGISGSVARAVGEKLRRLAQGSQVICITHLPQVASLAERHLLVQKHVGKRTTSSVSLLDDSGRVEEIARMLAGYDITSASRESAKELLASKLA